MPGLTPNVAAFGRRVADAGFATVLPSLFGEPGRDMSTRLRPEEHRSRLRVEGVLRISHCGRPVRSTVWLRALGEQGPRGMRRTRHRARSGCCFTGGFALAMMVDDRMLASRAEPAISSPPDRQEAAGRTSASATTTSRRLKAAPPRRSVPCSACGSPRTRRSPRRGFETLRRELGEQFIYGRHRLVPGNQLAHQAHGPLGGHRGLRRRARSHDPHRHGPGDRVLHRAPRQGLGGDGAEPGRSTEPGPARPPVETIAGSSPWPRFPVPAISLTGPRAVAAGDVPPRPARSPGSPRRQPRSGRGPGLTP